MKKTLIALLAFAGVAAADELTPAWSMKDIDVSGNNNYPITLSDATISSVTGYTAVITLNWTTVAHAPLFWLGTDDGSAYSKSTATFGFDKHRNHAGLFTTGGSAGNGTDNAGSAGITTTLQDYITGVLDAGISTTGTSLDGETLTFFLTSKGGTATLYSLTNKNEVVQIFTRSGMVQGDVTALHVGHWDAADNHHAGAMNIDLYNGVMDQSTMQSIAGAVVPEPTTATLSLLALAGLAARRRRL